MKKSELRNIIKEEILKEINIVKIKKIIEPYKNLSLECDGFTRVVSYLLNKNNIKHQAYVGKVTWKEKQIPLHYWVKVNNYIIDYKLQMWFGNKAPNGIIDIKKQKDLFYSGKKINMNVTDMIFYILTQ